MTPWRPRASSAGFYWDCSARAAFDWMRATGQLPAEPESAEERDSPYADLGTVIHFTLQDGIRAQFPGPAVEYMPTEAEVASAATLYGGSLTELNTASRDVARLAMEHLPVLAPTVKWLAEVEVETSWMSGHIDLLASDSSWLVDLKTTAKKPFGGKPKFAHVVQVLCYAELFQVKMARILYVDSLRAKWVLPVDIDVLHPDTLALRAMIREHFRNMVDNPEKFADAAIPSIGPKCSEDWCPHTAICRDRFFPHSGTCVGSGDVSHLAGIKAASNPLS